MSGFNNRLRQIILLIIIIAVAWLMVRHFYKFLPGVLGAITLYILSVNLFNTLLDRKWPRSWTALLFILFYTIIICLPVYIAGVLITPKLIALFDDPRPIMIAVQSFSDKVKSATGLMLFNAENIQSATQKVANNIPALLTETANFLTNLVLMFFILYYMLCNGRQMEKYLKNIIPVNDRNLGLLGRETIRLIRANAVGIPLLAVLQGSVSMLGYWLFGIEQYGLWAFLTGMASLIPIVGTGLIWVPLAVYLFATHQTANGIWLSIYSLIVTGNIDYIFRITILKKIGDVHPMITILGVIIGLSMFGFLGLIFGPLLISYFLLLIRIYQNEFFESPTASSDLKKGKADVV